MQKKILVLVAISLLIIPITGAQTTCKHCHPEENSEFNKSIKYTFLTCRHCHLAHNDSITYKHFLVRPEHKICTRCHTNVEGTHNQISPLHDELKERGCQANCTQCHLPPIKKHPERDYIITNHSMNASSISCISGNCHSERNIEWAESQIKEIKELVGNFHPEPEVYDIVPYFPSRYEISVVLGIAALGTLLFSLAIHIFKL